MREPALLYQAKSPNWRTTNIYFVQAGSGGPIKIGRADSVERRMRGLQTGCPQTLIVLAVFRGPARIERDFHARLADHHLRGEWYRPAAPVLREVEWAQMYSRAKDHQPYKFIDGTHVWLEPQGVTDASSVPAGTHA